MPPRRPTQRRSNNEAHYDPGGRRRKRRSSDIIDNDPVWSRHFRALLHYSDTHGTFRVPPGVVVRDDEGEVLLGDWLEREKMQMAHYLDFEGMKHELLADLCQYHGLWFSSDDENCEEKSDDDPDSIIQSKADEYVNEHGVEMDMDFIKMRQQEASSSADIMQNREESQIIAEEPMEIVNLPQSLFYDDHVVEKEEEEEIAQHSSMNAIMRNVESPNNFSGRTRELSSNESIRNDEVNHNALSQPKPLSRMTTMSSRVQLLRKSSSRKSRACRKYNNDSDSDSSSSSGGDSGYYVMGYSQKDSQRKSSTNLRLVESKLIQHQHLPETKDSQKVSILKSKEAIDDER